MTTDWETKLQQRALGQCELCGSVEGLSAFDVPPAQGERLAGALLLCEGCRDQSQHAVLDPAHWYCLKQSIWSAVPAVQVQSWRLLQRMPDEAWACDLLEQAYLEPEVLAWAEAALPSQAAASGAGTRTVDSNGTQLDAGDTVTLIKNLEVKGANFTAKRGTVVKNIRLTDNPEHVEGRINGSVIVLKTCFLKKQG